MRLGFPEREMMVKSFYHQGHEGSRRKAPGWKSRPSGRRSGKERDGFSRGACATTAPKGVSSREGAALKGRSSTVVPAIAEPARQARAKVVRVRAAASTFASNGKAQQQQRQWQQQRQQQRQRQRTGVSAPHGQRQRQRARAPALHGLISFRRI